MKDRLYWWLSQRLPRRLVGWCFMRVVAHATTGRYSNQEVPALTAMMALERWEKQG